MVPKLGEKRVVPDASKPPPKRQKPQLNGTKNVERRLEESEDVTSSDSYVSTDESTSSSEGDSDMSSGGSDAEEQPDSPISGDGTVMADFNFQQPREPLFQGLRSLLSGYLDGVEYDCSGLADFVIRQVCNYMYMK
jgi:hypothetical protein